MGNQAKKQLGVIGTDPVAFTEFYRGHVDEVMRFVVRRVGDPHLAADLTAEVFIAAITAAKSYRGSHGGPRTWLFGIARNLVNAELGKQAKQSRGDNMIAGRRLLDGDDIDRMTERIDAAREVRHLHARLQALPDGERAVLELVALDDLTVAEAASALGIRAVTARVRLHRARIAMRQALDEHPLIQQEVTS